MVGGHHHMGNRMEGSWHRQVENRSSLLFSEIICTSLKGETSQVLAELLCILWLMYCLDIVLDVSVLFSPPSPSSCVAQSSSSLDHTAKMMASF